VPRFKTVVVSLLCLVGGRASASPPSGPSVPSSSPSSPPQSCLCAQESDECLSPAPVVFEGRAISVVAETAFPGGVSRTCRGDAAEPAIVDKGCLVARVVRDGCKPLGKLKLSVRDGAGTRRWQAETAADGLARWCGLADGAYQVQAPGAVPVVVTLPAGAAVGAFVRVQVPAAVRTIVQTEFQVTKLLRGAPVKVAVVHVDDADCRFEFRAGQLYRVFASRARDGRLTTNGCSPTKEIRDTKWTCGSEAWIKQGRK
jgi:hypothetical protein